MSLENNSLILAAVAADYLKANPETTVAQLRQLFPMSKDDAEQVMRRVRSINPPADAKTTEAALQWAVNSNAGHARIHDRFGLGRTESRRVANAAKKIRAKIDADKIKRIEEAKLYALKHLSKGCKEIADKFNVSVYVLRRWHIEHRTKMIRRKSAKLEAEPAKATTAVRRIRRKMCGLVDGQWVPVEQLPQRAIPDRYSYEVV